MKRTSWLCGCGGVIFLGLLAISSEGLRSQDKVAEDSDSPAAAVEEHEFTGVSDKRSFEQALADALKQMDDAVAEQRVPCNSVNWRLVDITGRSGTPAGLHELRVKIAASFTTRDPLPRPTVAQLLGLWVFERGALGEFDQLDLRPDGSFLLEHRDVALDSRTTTAGKWSRSDTQVILQATTQERDGKVVTDFRETTESLRWTRDAEGMVLKRNGRDFHQRKPARP